MKKVTQNINKSLVEYGLWSVLFKKMRIQKVLY